MAFIGISYYYSRNRSGGSIAHRIAGILFGERGKRNKALAAEVGSSSGQEPAARKIGVWWDVGTSLVFTSCVTVAGTVLWMPGPSLVAQGGADSVLQAWNGL